MDEGFTVSSLSPLRRIIATRMAQAKRDIPHFRVVADIEVDALISLHDQLRHREVKLKLSLNDLLIKACAATLMEVPALNVQWVDGEIHQLHGADISVVTAIPGGLSTPIVRGAERKTVWEIAGELQLLRERAARNALKVSEVFGGSFSVSNLGMYGVDQFDAIINPPQCAILAVGRAKPQWTVSPERTPRIATVLRVTLSADHRALDGIAVAQFLSALRQRIEQPGELASV